MQVHRTLALAATLAVVTGGAVTTSAAAPAASASSTRTLEFVVHFRPFDQNFVDVGAPGLSIGDASVFRDQLLDAKGRTVGEEAGTCLVTDVVATGVQTLCNGGVVLRGGQIEFQGVATNAPRKTLAVVGGTGRYRGVTGEAVLVENGDDTGTLTLSLSARG
jgi:hypothetical protein